LHVFVALSRAFCAQISWKMLFCKKSLKTCQNLDTLLEIRRNGRTPARQLLPLFIKLGKLKTAQMRKFPVWAFGKTHHACQILSFCPIGPHAPLPPTLFMVRCIRTPHPARHRCRVTGTEPHLYLQ